MTCERGMRTYGCEDSVRGRGGRGEKGVREGFGAGSFLACCLAISLSIVCWVGECYEKSKALGLLTACYGGQGFWFVYVLACSCIRQPDPATGVVGVPQCKRNDM